MSAAELRWETHGYDGLQAPGKRGTWFVFVTEVRYTVWFQPALARGMLCLRNFNNVESAKAYCATQETRARG